MHPMSTQGPSADRSQLIGGPLKVDGSVDDRECLPTPAVRCTAQSSRADDPVQHKDPSVYLSTLRDDIHGQSTMSSAAISVEGNGTSTTIPNLVEYADGGGQVGDNHNMTSDSITVCSSVTELCNRPTFYPALWDKNCDHFIEGTYSPLKPYGWRSMLLDNGAMDQDALFLLDGILHGFKLVDPGADIAEYQNQNYDSAEVSSKEEMDSLIKTELSQGKFAISKDKPVCVHALGAIPKSSGHIRNITDCSRPKGLSVNNYMSETFSTFHYKSMDDVTAKLHQGHFMAITDISSAYRSVPIRPSDRTYQGLKWDLDGDEVYLKDQFLSFCTQVAPFIFSRISDAIVRCLDSWGIPAVNYLDDFIVFGTNEEECRSAQLTLHALLRSLGFHIAYKKVVSQNTTVTYLGVEIDSLKMESVCPTPNWKNFNQK